MKIKLLLAISPLLLVGFMSKAQTGWSWAKGYGTNSNESGYAVTTDASGNIITSGGFSSDTITIGSATLTCEGQYDALIFKNDASGNPVWAKSIGGSGWDRLLGIATDASGNIYAAGTFDSPTLDVYGTMLTNAGSSDMFIVKFDPNGNVLWAKSAGGTGEESCNSLTLDASGNVYVTGSFKSDTLTADTASLSNAYTPALFSDIFILKYDTDGNIKWVKSQDSGGGMQHEYAYSIAADASGGIVVVVNIPQLTAASITFGTNTVSNSNMVLVKYDSNGNVVWAKGDILGDLTGTPKIAIDGSDNIFVSGRFLGTHPNPALTPYLTVDGDTVPPIGDEDIFLIKYNGAGDVLWGRSYGGTNGDGKDGGASIAIDINGDVYIGTTSQSPVIQFGSFNINATSPTGGIVVAKIDGSNGNGIWANLAQSGSGMNCSGIALDIDANVFVTGWLNGSSPTFGAVTFTKPGANEDIYLAKIGEDVTSVKDITDKIQVSVYPNPSNGLVTITGVPAGAHVSMTDITGKIIYKSTSNDTSMTISTQNLVPGMYLIHIEKNGKFASLRVSVSI